jgi:hypothetical protein
MYFLWNTFYVPSIFLLAAHFEEVHTKKNAVLSHGTFLFLFSLSLDNENLFAFFRERITNSVCMRY